MQFFFSKNTLLTFLPLTIILCFSCGSGNKDKNVNSSEEIIIHDTIEIASLKGNSEEKSIVMGAERYESYLPLLQNKKIGVVANQTSLVRYEKFTVSSYDKSVTNHLVDFLIESKINIKKVFAPEHGFRGKADAGETVKDGKDTKTGLPITSLYGKNKKPTPDQLKGIDVMIFDIQDVGVRFYTYIATMHLVMEACAEAGIPVIILDRPNPNGHYIDGPMMEKEHTSFLGMHPVPLVHGMTIGEYAQMINGQGWLANGIKCSLEVIQMENYTHQTPYSLPVRPSPNLPNDVAINLYPSLGLLEGTNLSAGRGTEMQFQVIGSPHLSSKYYPFTYTPEPNFGSKYPKHQGKVCNGLDLRDTPKMSRADLSWIVNAYTSHQKKEEFFNTANFTAHAGTAKLQQQIEQGYTFREIRKTWLRDLQAYDKMRQPYLIYD
ncbi:MAG: DUF1343 domain-containing protein [Flavobacteriaceae bacterium]|nr:DUF1343 domain-containing protein [Flavobacteriaceae bacterium]